MKIDDYWNVKIPAKAIIYYNNTPHPSDSSYWGKKYQELYNESSLPIFFKRKFFNQYWKKLPIEENIDNTKFPISANELERLFEKYNLSDNPYMNKKGQQTLKRLGLRHTSMSVGDVIQIGGDFYIVAMIGFRKIKWE